MCYVQMEFSVIEPISCHLRAILVGGLQHEFYGFPFSWECHVIPTDEVIFFRRVGIPPTRICDFS